MKICKSIILFTTLCVYNGALFASTVNYNCPTPAELTSQVENQLQFTTEYMPAFNWTSTNVSINKGGFNFNGFNVYQTDNNSKIRPAGPYTPVQIGVSCTKQGPYRCYVECVYRFGLNPTNKLFAYAMRDYILGATCSSTGPSSFNCTQFP